MCSVRVDLSLPILSHLTCLLRYKHHVKPEADTDLAGQLLELLVERTTPLLSANSRAMAVLKTINQEMIAPVVLRMKTDVHERLPYKGVRSEDRGSVCSDRLPDDALAREIHSITHSLTARRARQLAGGRANPD